MFIVIGTAATVAAVFWSGRIFYLVLANLELWSEEN
jgi:hypothetical protein